MKTPIHTTTAGDTFLPVTIIPHPRRKPPFKTLRTHHGQIHTLHGETRLYTGCYEACGETYKWAAIGIKYARHEPTVQCDRKSAAKMLRTIRTEGVC